MGIFNQTKLTISRLGIYESDSSLGFLRQLEIEINYTIQSDNNVNLYTRMSNTNKNKKKYGSGQELWFRELPPGIGRYVDLICLTDSVANDFGLTTPYENVYKKDFILEYFIMEKKVIKMVKNYAK